MTQEWHINEEKHSVFGMKLPTGFQLIGDVVSIFYSEIPLPFPNSSYLLVPSNPNGQCRDVILRLCINLNQAIVLQ